MFPGDDILSILVVILITVAVIFSIYIVKSNIFSIGFNRMKPIIILYFIIGIILILAFLFFVFNWAFSETGDSLAPFVAILIFSIVIFIYWYEVNFMTSMCYFISPKVRHKIIKIVQDGIEC